MCAAGFRNPASRTQPTDGWCPKSGGAAAFDAAKGADEAAATRHPATSVEFHNIIPRADEFAALLKAGSAKAKNRP
jgi:hypothetical protein